MANVVSTMGTAPRSPAQATNACSLYGDAKRCEAEQH